MFGERFPKNSGADADYKTYQDALEQVKNDYLGDPADPQPRFANDLHAEVAQELGLEDWSGLKFYTAVNSALDRYHGVDAFFEYGDARVVMDATKNPAKAGGYKPGVMIIGEQELDYPAHRAEKAKEIADELKEHLQKAALKRQEDKRQRTIRRGLSGVRRRRLAK